MIPKRELIAAIQAALVAAASGNPTLDALATNNLNGYLARLPDEIETTDEPNKDADGPTH